MTSQSATKVSLKLRSHVCVCEGQEEQLTKNTFVLHTHTQTFYLTEDDLSCVQKNKILAKYP